MEDIQQNPLPTASQAQQPGCLLLISAVFGLYQIIFAFRVLHFSEIFTGSPVIPVPVHSILSALWGIILLWGVVLVARKKRSALPYMSWSIIAFVVYSLLRTIVFTQSDYDQGRLPFLIIITVAGLAIPVISLLSREKQRLD